MVKLAILHSTLPTYMAQSEQEEGRHLQVVLSEASDTARFMRSLPGTGAQVVVLDLALLGDDPEAVVARVEKTIRPEMTLIVYSFAKWSVVEGLRRPGRHVLRAPISVRALRSNLVNLIVRQLAGQAESRSRPETDPLEGSAPKRRYGAVQLAGLQEIRSEVDCECPNQVADLVLALNAFEDYSAQCRNRNEADARVHAMLYRLTGHARAIMERALQELCEFEGIEVGELPRRTG